MTNDHYIKFDFDHGIGEIVVVRCEEGDDGAQLAQYDDDGHRTNTPVPGVLVGQSYYLQQESIVFMCKVIDYNCIDEHKEEMLVTFNECEVGLPMRVSGLMLKPLN